MKKVVIGITDCNKYENYASWMFASNENLEIIKLSEKYFNPELVKRCSGILFTGGEDIHPRFYNKPEYLSYCNLNNMNEKRDEFELELLEYTQRHRLPVMGICRGLQITNIYFGGTLIPDLPSWNKPDNSKHSSGEDRYHYIKVKENSWMAQLTGSISGYVNSSHHQAADLPGDGLTVAAYSEGYVIEAIERMKPNENSFLCLVQWHPERMHLQDNSFTGRIRDAFIKACINYNRE